MQTNMKLSCMKTLKEVIFKISLFLIIIKLSENRTQIVADNFSSWNIENKRLCYLLPYFRSFVKLSMVLLRDSEIEKKHMHCYLGSIFSANYYEVFMHENIKRSNFRDFVISDKNKIKRKEKGNCRRQFFRLEYRK